MKATFIGDPTQPNEAVPAKLTHLGLVFEKGKATEVPPELEAKFAGNSHFKVTGAESDKAKA